MARIWGRKLWIHFFLCTPSSNGGKGNLTAPPQQGTVTRSHSILASASQALSR